MELLIAHCQWWAGRGGICYCYQTFWFLENFPLQALDQYHWNPDPHELVSATLGPCCSVLLDWIGYVLIVDRCNLESAKGASFWHPFLPFLLRHLSCRPLSFLSPDLYLSHLLSGIRGPFIILLMVLEKTVRLKDTSWQMVRGVEIC